MNETAQPEVIRDYLASQGLSPTVPERFWAKVDKTSSLNGCWLWTASTHHGYGMLNPGNSIPIGAHVVSWIINRGPIPKGGLVLHKCPGKHNRRCCNPTHLKIGGKAENGRDSIAQGTNSFCLRDDKYRVKLDPAIALEIRSRWIGYRGQQTELAKTYGVSRHAISLIVRNRTWAA